MEFQARRAEAAKTWLRENLETFRIKQYVPK
jgi:hypothetical protein